MLIASSPYLRAVETVTPLADALGLPVRTWAELREWDSGLEPSPDYERHYAASWADPDLARPGGESLRALSARATAILRALAAAHPDGTVVVGGDGTFVARALAGSHAHGTVVVGSHGTFVARALAGFGVDGVDWPFARAMPMPAVYRLRLTPDTVHATGPGLPP